MIYSNYSKSKFISALSTCLWYLQANTPKCQIENGEKWNRHQHAKWINIAQHPFTKSWRKIERGNVFEQ